MSLSNPCMCVGSSPTSTTSGSDWPERASVTGTGPRMMLTAPSTPGTVRNASAYCVACPDGIGFAVMTADASNWPVSLSDCACTTSSMLCMRL